MTVSWHVVAKLLTVSRISKVDRKKVLPKYNLNLEIKKVSEFKKTIL